jgi:RNA polymerase sigma-70 factor (ECF subfamily)
MLTDAAFMDQLRCGDAAAWHRLAVKFRQPLRHAAAVALPRDVVCRADASDVVQQTFSEANRSFADFRGHTMRELHDWLMAILDHNVRDAVREHVLAQRRSVKSERRLNDSSQARANPRGNLVAEVTPPILAAYRGELHERLHAALARLPERQQLAVRLRHLEGQPLDEIAAQLACTKQAAAAIIARGLRALRAVLGDIT